MKNTCALLRFIFSAIRFFFKSQCNKLLFTVRKALDACFRNQNGILNPYAKFALKVYAGFNCLDHARFDNAVAGSAEARLFMNKQTERMTESVAKASFVAVVLDVIACNFVDVGIAHTRTDSLCRHQMGG